MKKRRRVLALFISIFFRNRSLSDARWFSGKKRKIGKGNLYLTENRLSWNKMFCASDNHNYMCHTCAKDFFKIWASIKQLLTKYQIFTILPQISHFHNNRNFSSMFATFLDQLLHPYKFYGRDMSGILFFIFASCEPLIHDLQYKRNGSQNDLNIWRAILKGSDQHTCCTFKDLE